LERDTGPLRSWLEEWIPAHARWLEPADWLTLGHGIVGYQRHSITGREVPQLLPPTVFVWSPPPYAGDIAISQLRLSRHKRTEHTHVFIIPRLATPLWMRHLYRAADIVFEVPVNSPFWPSSMHEPLLIGIVFPFIRCDPWQLRSTPKFLATARKLRKVWQTNPLDTSTLLRELWTLAERLRTVPSELVQRMLYFSPKPQVSHSRNTGGSTPDGQ